MILGQRWSIRPRNPIRATNECLFDSFSVQSRVCRFPFHLTGDSFIVHTETCREPHQGLQYILKYLLQAPIVEGGAAEYNEVFKDK